ncbi:MAG: translation initiation factor IF-2 [Candidatus Pacebacteria bacterium]|nr:translation initiation factor IF-2 [Candidatus Paceibacterota bacterium]
MAQLVRPPIITIMGHVDHGKTTLLDYLRQTNVQQKEAGGITQHIGAYQIDFKGKKITFIDTPGHAAFNKMRQRGAEITDIVILIISAKDGVQPQTVESIEYIKESGVSFIVALNKMDLEGANPDQVKAELAEQEVLVHEYGGEVDVVEISAKTGQGVDELLETVTVLAELMELKADPQAPLEAVVVESTKDQYKGPIARVIVKQGTLEVRQELEVDEITGRVRSLIDERGQQLDQVEPGSPAEVLGLNDVPKVGAIIKQAGADYPEEKVEEQLEDSAEFDWSDLDFDALMGDKEKLNLIVKTDVEGTLEAVTQAVDEEAIEIISAEAGPVSEGDLELAETSNALIVVFSQKVSSKMMDLAKQLGVKIKQYDIIYHLLEDLEKHKERILNPRAAEKELGRAEILQIFEIDNQRIAGVRVVTGQINKHDKIHLIRDGEIIQDVVISSLKHGKEDIETVKAKSEAGIHFKNKKLDFKPGDELMAYTIEE